MPPKKVRNGIKKNPTTTQPAPAVEQKERTEFCCDRCGKIYNKQNRNFPATHSPFFAGNNGYMSTCFKCFDEIYQHYLRVFDDEATAIYRVCMRFDIYWSREIFENLNSGAKDISRIRKYNSMASLMKYVDNNFDTTLDEAAAAANVSATELDSIDMSNPNYDAEPENVVEIEILDHTSPDPEPEPVVEEITVPDSVVRYWGPDFTNDMYEKLDARRLFWLDQLPPGTELDAGEEALLRQICVTEIQINKDAAAGRPVERLVNSLNTLLGSMNIKPSQKKEAEEEYVPFGVDIKRYEDTDPIPEVDPMFADVDGLRKNVISWFLGSLCKTAGIKNEYSSFFEDEVSKYTVEKPNYEDDVYEDGGDSYVNK